MAKAQRLTHLEHVTLERNRVQHLAVRQLIQVLLQIHGEELEDQIETILLDSYQIMKHV